MRCLNLAEIKDRIVHVSPPRFCCLVAYSDCYVHLTLTFLGNLKFSVNALQSLSALPIEVEFHFLARSAQTGTPLTLAANEFVPQSEVTTVFRSDCFLVSVISLTRSMMTQSLRG